MSESGGGAAVEERVKSVESDANGRDGSHSPQFTSSRSGPHPEAPPSHGNFLQNMLLFARLLRGLSIPVTPTQILDLVEALTQIDLRVKAQARDASRAILVSRQEHLELFDEAFDLFWRAREKQELARINLGELLQQTPQGEIQYRLIRAERDRKDERDQVDQDPLVEKIYTYSSAEALRSRDFATMTEYELQQVKLFMQQLQWTPAERRTRRRVPASRGDQVDLRRSLRQNVRYGGEPLVIARRERKTRRRPIIALADISGSMDRYSRVLLQFLYSITHAIDKVEAFVFSTRLTRITRHLKRRDIDQALDQTAHAVHDWAGGTRIGEAIRAFNFDWARRVCGQGAIVLVISDGWDRGDPEMLGQEMSRLQRSCHRLIWLNPLLGSPSYEPLTRGIQAALPHTDDFLPVHNLISLEQLAQVMADAQS
ncbi:MAG: VWA domain-containing protein [Caldilineaceae bacterium]|nr:VWA domain-containing protein [Caldilineaceae bacterium]MDE0337754.1 VWA domain-containing protein [Caldilineaceae bacterium]